MIEQRDERDAIGTREVHLRDYWKVLWHGRYTFIAVFLLVVAATAVYTFTRTSIYRATAIVEVEAQAKRLSPGQDVSGMGATTYGWWAEEKYHNTQMEIIRSRDVAERAFNNLSLKSHPMFEAADNPVEAFRSMIAVEQRRKTSLIEISIMGTDANEITRWVNAIATAYVERNIDRAEQNVRMAVNTIRNEIESLQAELTVAEDEVFDILRETEVYDAESQRAVVSQRLSEYNTQHTETQLLVGQLENRLQRLDEIQRKGEDPMVLPDLASNTQLQALNSQKVDLEKQIEAAKVDFRPGHPTYEEKVRQLSKVEQQIREQLNLIMANIQDDHDAAKKKEELLRDRIREAEGLLFRLNMATARVNLKKTDAETKKQIYDLLTRNMNEVQLAAGLLSNNVSILDPADVPRYPVKPVKRVNLAVGGLFGLFLGLGLVFFIDYLDNTFRTPQDIEEHLQLSVLGVIPKIQDGERGSRAVKEAYQSLRTSIIFSSKNRERRVMLITSTGPQEGKSSTIANLGRMLASAGDRVIILDCDLRRPTQHLHHDVKRDVGLTNFLAAPKETTDWRPYRHMVSDTLHLMPCGPIPPSPPELIGSERFAKLIDDLRREYDWVLLDSPPAASLADSTQLAAVADMVVLVIRHNHSDKDLVQRNIHQLRARNAVIAGAVLNNVDIDKVSNKDYYYSGYYYLDEEGRRKKEKKSRQPVAKVKVG